MSLLPREVMIDSFLQPALHGELLRYVMANARRFEPAKIASNDGGRIDERLRRGLKWRDLGPLRAPLEGIFRAAAPALARDTGAQLPPSLSLELELTACGDAAHFVPHIDIPVGPERKLVSGGDGTDRLLSAVLYFHRWPKGFGGGELRLLPWGEDDEGWRDIEPKDNRLVVFPSWARHEVRPVSCPSGRFEDYRFGLSCWFCAPLR